jgi:hypothetical protein
MENGRLSAGNRSIPTPDFLHSREPTFCEIDAMPYRHCIVDNLLDAVFPHLAAVALEGAK